MPPPPAACAALKKMEERCVLNPYCDLNKAIANRASHHPIWKRWAKKTKNQDTMKKKKKVPFKLNSWILLLTQENVDDIWHTRFISLLCVSPVFGNKQTLPILYI